MEQSYMLYKYLGGFAALASAGAWAFGSLFLKKLGDEISPFGVNLGKCVIGCFYLGIILLLVGIKPVSNQAFWFLGLSGLLGITLGDTFFVKSLVYLGPRLALLLGTLGPIITVVLAVVFLKERPALLTWLGIFITIIGVSWVIWERSSKQGTDKNRALGIKYGLLSTFCSSVAIIFAKVGVANVSALQATFIRLAWGGIALVFWGIANRRLKNWMNPYRDIRLLKLAFFCVFIGIFGGFFLFLFSLKYIGASSATTLNCTTPLFILPIAAFALKEKITLRIIAGTVIAVFGVILIFAG
ncbi:MAG: DMT family transporter [Candidatus Omnitrophica bacterium]|nr:DMT family transporter [Candidatus Omnitrophota bacterium]